MAEYGVVVMDYEGFEFAPPVKKAFVSTTRSPLPGVDALELTIDDLPEFLGVLSGQRARDLGKRRHLLFDIHCERDVVMLDQASGTAERPEHAVLEDRGYGLAHVHNPSRSRIT